MTIAIGKPDAWRDAEMRLAEHQPFGDPSYLNERMWFHQGRRLEMLIDHLPVAKKLLANLDGASEQSRYRILGDPVVRCTIDATLYHLRQDLLKAQDPLQPAPAAGDWAKVLDIAADLLAEESLVAPLEAASHQTLHLGAAPYHAWVWSENRADDVFGRSFKRYFDLYLGSTELTVSTPDAHSQQMLAEGTKLLGDLLPALEYSALNHAHVVIVVEHNFGFRSLSHPSVPGAIFLSPTVLDNPWHAAEYLLHEAMHQKFVDLEDTHSLFRQGYRTERSPLIPAVWHTPRPGKSNQWSVNRAFTACHVYTCLALFFCAVDEHWRRLADVYGPLQNLDPTASVHRALGRAHYLMEKLRENGEELGPAGRRFVDWLADILGAAGSCSLGDGRYDHLLAHDAV